VVDATGLEGGEVSSWWWRPGFDGCGVRAVAGLASGTRRRELVGRPGTLPTVEDPDVVGSPAHDRQDALTPPRARQDAAPLAMVMSYEGWGL
jgi:hypothetical protein